MIIGALILTIIGLLLAIMAGSLSANNLSPVPAMLGVIGSVIVIAALAPLMVRARSMPRIRPLLLRRQVNDTNPAD